MGLETQTSHGNNYCQLYLWGWGTQQQDLEGMGSAWHHGASYPGARLQRRARTQALTRAWQSAPQAHTQSPNSPSSDKRSYKVKSLESRLLQWNRISSKHSLCCQRDLQTLGAFSGAWPRELNQAGEILWLMSTRPSHETRVLHVQQHVACTNDIKRHAGPSFPEPGVTIRMKVERFVPNKAQKHGLHTPLRWKYEVMLSQSLNRADQMGECTVNLAAWMKKQ